MQASIRKQFQYIGQATMPAITKDTQTRYMYWGLCQLIRLHSTQSCIEDEQTDLDSGVFPASEPAQVNTAIPVSVAMDSSVCTIPDQFHKKL